MKIQDKIYTFRHQREIKFPFKSITEKEAQNILIEEELKRGYIPINLTFRRVEFKNPLKLEVIQYDQVYCYSAYAGKKSARELHKRLSTEQIKGNAGDIIKLPYSKR